MHSLNSFKKLFFIALVIGIVFFFIWSSYAGQPNKDSLSDDDEFPSFKRKVVALQVKNQICHVEWNDSRGLSNIDTMKTIYFVTPTYPRPEQIPELTRLCHTLMHVPQIHWIIADDTPVCSSEVHSILVKSRLPYTHISSPKPYKYFGSIFPRGVANRLASLKWLRENVKKGILYFGDDDNTFDLELFMEIRKTKKFSMFPVGLIGGYGVSSPIVEDGKVVAFFDSWPGERTFPVDMAGFAVNVEVLTPNATMPYQAGYEEDKFLVNLGLNINDIEPLAENCTKVLVWHTRTFKYKKPSLMINMEKVGRMPKFKSLVKLLSEMLKLGMAQISPDTGIKPIVLFPKQVYQALPNYS